MDFRHGGTGHLEGGPTLPPGLRKSSDNSCKLLTGMILQVQGGFRLLNSWLSTYNWRVARCFTSTMMGGIPLKTHLFKWGECDDIVTFGTKKPNVKWSVYQTHLLDIKTSPPKKPTQTMAFRKFWWQFRLTRVACRMKNGGGQSAADRRIAAVVCPSAHETESGASATWVQVWRSGGFNLLPPL